MTAEGVRSTVVRAALAGGVVAVTLGQTDFARGAAGGGGVLLILGVALAATAGRLLRSPATGAPPGRLEAREWAFLAAVTAAAGAVRFVALDRLPPGGFFDEAQNVLVADQILKGHLAVYVGDYTQMPAFFFYLLAAAVGIVGKSIVAARGLSALLGTATVPLFYLLARRLSPGWAAAASTILLAGSRWHVNFSRVGFTGALCPLIEILSVLALLKALERGRRRDYLLLGVAVAAGLQGYYAYNLFPLVLAVTAAAHMWLPPPKQPPPAPRRVLRGLAWSALAAAVLLAPLAVYALSHTQEFLRRSSTVAIWNPSFHLDLLQSLWDNTRAHLLMFNYRGDWNPRHNITDWPLLSSIEGVLFAVGVGCALGRPSRRPQAIALAWFAVMLLPGILTIEAPQAYRTIGVIPAVFLLVALALDAILRSAAGAASGRRAWWPVGASLAALAACAAAQNVVTYFALQVRDPGAWSAFEADYREAARTIRSEAGRYRIWVDPVYYDFPIMRLDLGDGFRYERFVLGQHVPGAAPRSGARERGDFYLLEGFEKDLVPLFRRAFPQARAQQHLDPFGRVMFVTIAVPGGRGRPAADPSLADRGYLAAFYPNARWEEAPTFFRRDPAVFFHFHWDGEGPPSGFGADWTARLRADDAGEYAFDLVASGPAIVVVDGTPVVAQDRVDDAAVRRGTIHLERGDHLLAVRYQRAGYAATVRLWWRPPGAPRACVIPLDDLTPLGREEYRRLAPTLPLPPDAGGG